MKVLVTGGAGFIGSNFVRYYLQTHPEDTVIVFDALTYAGNSESLTDLTQNPRYRFIKGDICNPHDVEKAMEGVETIVHFAAESHVDRSIHDPLAFAHTNVIGTLVLLEAAKKNKVLRFHHVSTDEVFGSLELNDGELFTELTPYDPRSPYSASKASSDHFVRAYYHTYNLPITITNCSNNYGPYQFPEKFVPLIITNAIDDIPIPVYGDGLNVRDWLYVEDHVTAIDLVLKKGKIGDTYCIGGLTEDISNLDIAKKILRILGKDESLLTFVNDRPGHDRRYALDWSKIKNELGWKPEHDFDTRLNETVEWYRNNQTWWRHVKDGSYREYYQRQYPNAS